MNLLKRLTASVLSIAMLAGMTACSGQDKTWAAKTNEKTIPIGVYIYNQYVAYQTASTKVEDAAKPVLEQKVEDKDAATWIKEQALNYTKQIFALDNKMKELNLTLTEEETKEIASSANTQWAQYGSTLEGYGIAKESYTMAYSEVAMKSNKVFEAIYGKGGTMEVSDAQLKEFFERNYTDFSYVLIPLYDPNTYAPLEEATETEYKKFLEDQAAALNKGSTTFAATAEATKQKLKLDYAPTQDVTTFLNEESGYPIELITMINGMKVGEAKTITLTASQACVLVIKNDATKKTAAQLAGDSTRDQILKDMKQTEFIDTLTTEANALTNITVNQKALDSYQPSMFVTKDNGSSSSAE